MANFNTSANNTGVHSFLSAAYAEKCILSASLKQYLWVLIYSLLLLLFMLLSIFLNITIIAVVGCTKRLHTVPYVFIVSLAVSDLINASVTTFRQLLSMATWLTDGRCRMDLHAECISYFLAMFSVVSNIGNHLVISLERWFYIALPFTYQRIVTRRITALCLVSVWIISSLVNFNIFLDNCGLQHFTTSVNLGIISPVFHFTLTFLMFVIYSHITFITYRQMHCINKIRVACAFVGTQDVLKTRTLVATKWRSVRMLVVVFGTFFVCVTPGVCSDLYAYVYDNNFYVGFVAQFVDFLWVSHCFLNFCIYAVQDRMFRIALKQCLLKICCFRCPKRVYPRDSTNLQC